MNIISCKEYAAIKKEELKQKISLYKEQGKRQPTLIVIQVDNDSASESYVNGKKRDCSQVGIKCIHDHIDSKEFSQNELEKRIKEYDASIGIHGIIVQLPLPDKYNVERLQKCISPEKDVDGFRKDSFHIPCTPKGIKDWLEYNNYKFKGKNATVLGRSPIVGKPMNDILIEKGMTVTCCNSSTDNFTRLHAMRNSDLVIVATGQKEKFEYGHFYGAMTKRVPEIIVDVGIHQDDVKKWCGDVKHNEQFDLNNETYLTPVPGGVGLLTRVSLLDNVHRAYLMIEKM